MNSAKPCPECDGREIYRHRYLSVMPGDARGLALPELGGSFQGAAYVMLLCSDCGHARIFASKEARSKLTAAVGWIKMPVEPGA